MYSRLQKLHQNHQKTIMTWHRRLNQNCQLFLMMMAVTQRNLFVAISATQEWRHRATRKHGYTGVKVLHVQTDKAQAIQTGCPAFAGIICPYIQAGMINALKPGQLTPNWARALRGLLEWFAHVASAFFSAVACGSQPSGRTSKQT